MTPLLIALLLVTTGAAFHAAWNILVKRAGTTDVMFVWTYSAIAVPVAVIALGFELIRVGGGPWMGAAVVSALLHTVYAVMLQRAYGRADMSIVYPISRGLTPAIVALGALPFTGSPSGIQGVALLLVLGGAWAASSPAGNVTINARGLGAGVLVAACTATYTTWDAYSVIRLHVPLVAYFCLLSIVQFTGLSLALRTRSREFSRMMRTRWRQALPIAVLVPASYILVLIAMHFGPPSMVATARCMNVVMGTLLAVTVLHEHISRRQTLGIAAITVGAIASAL